MPTGSNNSELVFITILTVVPVQVARLPLASTCFTRHLCLTFLGKLRTSQRIKRFVLVPCASQSLVLHTRWRRFMLGQTLVLRTRSHVKSLYLAKHLCFEIAVVWKVCACPNTRASHSCHSPANRFTRSHALQLGGGVQHEKLHLQTQNIQI